MNDQIELLKQSILNTRPQIKGIDKSREAAVVIPLIQKEGQWHVLFEVRSSRLRSQPGDVCFPGGKIDECETPKEAALREACEELLIQPNQISLLGQVDGTLGPSWGPMWAFVVTIDDYQNTFSTDEVEEIFLIPLDTLLCMKPVVGTTEFHVKTTDGFPFHMLPDGTDHKWKVRTRKEPFYAWQGHVIWGATARLLTYFLERFAKV